MQIRLLDPLTRRTTEWSGGKTTELFLFPETGSYAERRFQFRISSAVIQTPESTFTPLPGVTRFLTPLSDGFYLRRNGAWSYLARGQVLEFSGDEEIVSRGTGRDLNLMLKNARGSMRIVFSGESAFTPHTFLFLYCPEETDVSGAVFPADSLLRLYPNGEKILSVSKPSVLFTIDL